jgi:hypothetical protein
MSDVVAGPVLQHAKTTLRIMMGLRALRQQPAPLGQWLRLAAHPRWLTAAIKSGKKLEHFAIAAKAKTVATKRMATRPRQHRSKLESLVAATTSSTNGSFTEQTSADRRC